MKPLTLGVPLAAENHVTTEKFAGTPGEPRMPVLEAPAIAIALAGLAPEWGGGGTPRPGEPGAAIFGAAIDSRQVRPGDLFVALPGARAHGATFARSAQAAGAALTLIARADRALLAPDLDLRRVLWVDDAPLALSALGRAARAAHETLKVVAITGSFGKTTTKDMVAGVLGASFRVHATAGNLNNQLGVPLTLLGLTDRHQAAVIELGMSAPGEILALATLARPRIGVLTGVGRAHLAGLGSRAAILAAKLELATALGSQGRLVLSADDPEVLAAARAMGVPLLTASTAGTRPPGVDLVAEAIAISPAGVTFRVRGRGFDGQEIVLPTPARVLTGNALLALLVGSELGVPAAAMAAALARIVLPARRLSLKRAQGRLVLDDCYNASPESMAAALATLGELPVRRRVGVLGDMRELGPGTLSAHEELGRRAAEVLDLLFVIGEEAETVAAAAIAAGMPAGAVMVAQDRAQLVSAVRGAARPGDGILVKASRALGLEVVAEALTQDPAQPPEAS
jgi:UDP-N-acetylmuramoyl-tripeptide--D-alanyl-D-alanine ligase